MSPRDVDLAALKERVRLSAHVQRRVKLRRAGGEWWGLCPFHSEKTPSFSVNDNKLFFHCFSCGAHGDIFDWLQRFEGLSLHESIERLRREAVEGASAPRAAERREPDRETARKQADARAIWEASRPIGGTVAETYLREARAIGVALPNSLRFHPGLRIDPHNDAEFPAMVAAVTDLAGSIVAIQRTFLALDGKGKASFERPKRALGPVGQGAVCLAPAGPVVGLAEGIETGLSAMEIFRVPVWCALGSNLARLVLPERVRNVAIFADRGEAGERAAAVASRTFHDQGRKVAIRFPERGKDFNDELKARRRGI